MSDPYEPLQMLMVPCFGGSIPKHGNMEDGAILFRRAASASENVRIHKNPFPKGSHLLKFLWFGRSKNQVSDSTCESPTAS